MYNKLMELLEQGQYRDVLAELEQYSESEYTEELIIIAVSTLMALEEYEEARKLLHTGFRLNPKSAELFLLLGNYYEHYNRMQAYLCYENAELYCENPEDRRIILDFKENLEAGGDLDYRKVAIVILSYNSYEMTRFCIESIRQNNVPSSYEIIVVDNASTDKSLEWLEQQRDVVLIKNSENKGFPYGCNQGIEAADPRSDILLLNNDTIVFPNSLFWLRMGLYENERVGATGSVTNNAPHGQTISERFETIQEYEEYATRNNVLQENPYELKFFLVGFAVLIRRKALDEIGGLDIRYSPGQFEDCDLGLDLCQRGYSNILCHNSFIYHFRSGAGQNRSMWQGIYQQNKAKFIDKWAFDIIEHSHAKSEMLDLLDCREGEAANVLEVGCGLGATLARIQFLYPDVCVYGMEAVPELAAIGGSALNIVQCDMEKEVFPFGDIQFDYIILSDLLERMHDPERTVRELAKHLKEGGAFLCSISNLMNLSVVYSLLQGRFEYEDDGILDKRHLRFYTLDSICRLFSKCGFGIDKLQYRGNRAEWDERERECLEAILKIPGCADEDQFLASQYLFRARPM